MHAYLPLGVGMGKEETKKKIFPKSALEETDEVLMRVGLEPTPLS